MFCVMFEVLPEPAQVQTYLDLAAGLKPEVERNAGFISVERFQSRTRPGWLLSLQFWHDDAAIAEWRRHGLHRRMQERGRRDLFRDYRLRIGPLIEAAAERERTVMVVEAGADVLKDPVPGFVEQDVFDSLYNPGRSVLLAARPGPAAAFAWREATAAPNAPSRVSIVAVARDYTRTDRTEAPAEALR